VDVEGDDRSAATGRPTAKVVVRLRGGEVIVPVRRGQREVCEKEVAKLERMLGLATPTVLPTPSEDLPGGRYVSVAEAGAGMRPIVDGSATLIGAGEEGGVLIRLGDGPPWLLVGADRARFWARAVGLPAGWDGDREVGRAWATSLIHRVRDVPAAAAIGEGAGLVRSDVWVEMRDGARVRVARGLAEAEAVAIVAAVSRAIALPSRWGRSRAYLDERVAETLGPRGGVSGDGPAGMAAGGGRSDRRAGAIVLPYAREPAGAVRIVRGDGVLRVSVPPVAFWRGWIRHATVGLPGAVLVVVVLLVLGGGGTLDRAMAGVAAWAVVLLWLGGSALASRGARTELVVADGTLRVEHLGLFRRRQRRWALEDVLSVREGWFPWTVRALVREPTSDGQLTRTERRLLTWDVGAERRRVVEVVRAAVGLETDAGKG
jgi:hypothetical protein